MTQGRNRSMAWVPLTSTRGGKSLYHSTNISTRHSLWREIYAVLFVLLETDYALFLGGQNRHTTLNITKVNTYGLVYFWPGSDLSLKPIMFAAHQGEVVPVGHGRSLTR
jgi:hypothetical protein